MLTISDYADWVYREVAGMPPHLRVLNDWQCNWCRTLNGIAQANGIFELISVVLSKCEFLGSLFRGNICEKTFDANSQNIFTWWIGFSPSTRANHLTVVNGRIHVDGSLLIDEFRQSLTSFALFLQANNRFPDNSLSGERFQRAFWVRFLPLHLLKQDWIQEGTRRGIPFPP